MLILSSTRTLLWSRNKYNTPLLTINYAGTLQPGNDTDILAKEALDLNTVEERVIDHTAVKNYLVSIRL